MEELLIILVSFAIGFIGAEIIKNLIKGSNNCYCNRNYNYGKNSQELKLKAPEYVVKKVEQVYCKNDITACAKYTLQNWHIKKKNDIEMQELYLYDEVGKYNIGDILVFGLKR